MTLANSTLPQRNETGGTISNVTVATMPVTAERCTGTRGQYNDLSRIGAE